MIFVKYTETLSQTLRGDNIAKALGCPSLLNTHGGAKGDVVVFVKWYVDDVLKRAKDDGNLIVLDPIDYFGNPNLGMPGNRELVDVVIAYNTASFKFYKRAFPNAVCTIIPHQWDERLTGQCPQDRFRPGYIGAQINVPTFWTGDCVIDEEQPIERAVLYNCHLSLNRRTPSKIMLKPATKIATAAAVGAVALAYKDPSALELLGEDYPFWVVDNPEESVTYAESRFLEPDWRKAREMMRRVRERTSMNAICDLYRKFDRGVRLQDSGTEDGGSKPLSAPSASTQAGDNSGDHHLRRTENSRGQLVT